MQTHPDRFRPVIPAGYRSVETPYDPLVRSQEANVLPINAALLKPGMRVAVGLSGGADSVALLRALAARSGELGLVIHAAYLLRRRQERLW